MSFASTWNNLFKHWISSEFLLIEGYVQGAVVLLINFVRDEKLFTGYFKEGAAY